MRAQLKSVKIQKLLLGRNVSQNNFAIKTGTTSGYMSQLMSGHRCPSPKLRQKIMEFLKVSDFSKIFRTVE
jgi:transcriptional regulator with XRE-family HTH domain